MAAGMEASIALGGAIGLMATCTATSALSLGTGSRWRPLALVTGALALVVPWLLPPDAIVARALLALVAALLVMRSVDLWRDRRPWPLGRRLMLLTSIFDARELKPLSRRFEAGRLLATVAYAGVCLFGWWLAVRVAPGHEGAAHWLLRWAGGLLLIYGAADSLNGLTTLVMGAVGVQIPEQHRTPAAARSVAEFWAQRWNRNTQAWLRDHCFRPVARRWGARWGVVAAFAASALLHYWLIVVPFGHAMAAVMASFFVLQALFIIAERALRHARWPRPLQHAWTIVLMVGSSPLFTEPFVRLFE